MRKKFGVFQSEEIVAGGCLALLYAYRDVDTAPVPVKMVFAGVAPSSFYPEDWDCFDFDKNLAAAMFSVMTGKKITVEMFGTESYEEAIKDISALSWVSENTVPTILAYGTHDKMQSYPASIRLERILAENNVPHKYIVFEHSEHGLQNDNMKMIEYNEAIIEYLDRYMK